MAYTTTDLTNVETAIRAIVNGERIVRCSIGDNVFEYAEADLNLLRELKAEITINLSTTRPRFLLARTDKGL